MAPWRNAISIPDPISTNPLKKVNHDMTSMTPDRETVLQHATAAFDSGAFFDGLADLVALRTESQNPTGGAALVAYVERAIPEKLAGLGFTFVQFANPVRGGGPLLLAERIEDPKATTVLYYGHGDVVLGMEGRWSKDRDPWTLTAEGRAWFGRGTADNKGQHWVAISALRSVLEKRGRLGFNIKILIETSEEIGSPGLREFCQANAALLAADVMIGSDGPRLSRDYPTLFMGSRGSMVCRLRVRCRDDDRHSGNWGGVLSDPVVRLAHAIASIVDARGKILVPEWRPDTLTAAVRKALSHEAFEIAFEGAGIDRDWGEPGLTPAERLFGWNNFSVLAIESGSVSNPVNVIRKEAEAVCQLRYVVGTEPTTMMADLRRHLDAHGFDDVAIMPARDQPSVPTRLDPDHAWARFAVRSMTETEGLDPIMLPNLAATLPNDCFSDVLGLPTVWIPHSFPECGQHTIDEHVDEIVLRQGLRIMTGLFFDIGCEPPRQP
jgi:acetylornithine deacetylase/succinyl-diaminopimelate desuccinylase-like protein